MIHKTQFPDDRVLLVESHMQTALLYRFTLEDMGFVRLISATNTEEALDQMYFNAPALVILGAALSPRSTPAFLADIRAGLTGAASHVPVLAVCTGQTRTAVERSNAGGVIELVQAPVSMSRLRKHVCAAMQQRQGPACAPQDRLRHGA